MNDTPKREHSPLGTDDLEYLDRLVMRGEGLIMDGLIFTQAEALLNTGHARVLETYGPIRLIVPTELGCTLAAIRERLKLERLSPPPKELK
jgi:hypothetical protein